LSEDVVHIWQINLLQPDAVVQKLGQTLSEDEVQRAHRFRFEQDRRRFVVGRGQLRSILSHYTGNTASSVQFTYGPKGKPFLAGPSVNSRCSRSMESLAGEGIRNFSSRLERNSVRALQFNMSHSQDLALCAVATQREVGIDLEYLRPLPEAEQLAKRFFSRAEQALIQGVPVEEQAQVFFRLWTAKEAYLKATGKGLGHPLAQVEIIRTEDSWTLSKALSRWFMQSFTPTTNYLAALVVENLERKNQP
jgi:4'-phosphopantetheinyl transferase